MDLKDRIKNLADATTSKEVKALCQTYLNESEGKGIDKDTMLTESLFNDLKKAAANDDLVAELLNETDSYAVNKRKIEAKISGRAAAQLMENWKAPTSSSPVGNLKNNALENDNKNKAAAAKALNEGLSLAAKTDPSAGKVLKDLRVESYGIAEAIQTIKKSKVMSTPQLKYAVTRFETHLENNVSESRFVKDFLSSMAGFAWDPTVSEAYSSVKTLADAKSIEIEVQNAIQIIAEQDKKNFFDIAIKSLNQWLMNEKRSIPGLVNEMKQWMFNPVVKNLVKHVQLLENSYGNKFNVPVSASNCSINKIYSPVHMVAEGTVFRAGDTYFLSSKAGITILTEGQVNGLPVDYTTLCEQFFNRAVRVSDEGIHVNIGSTKVTINEDGTFIGESAVDPADLGQKLLMHTQQTMFNSDNNLITVAVKLQENQEAIAEIDYGKSVFSNLYENVGVYLFRKNDKIYINKVNPSMNENTFNEANAVQTVNLVKDFLNYDLSESLIDMLDGDLKKKALMESAMNDVLNNITLVETEINKIENAIAENADLGDVEEIQKAKDMLESELNKLKSMWHAQSTELDNFVTVMENEDEDEDDDDEQDDDGDDDGDDDPTPTGGEDAPAEEEEEEEAPDADDLPPAEEEAPDDEEEEDAPPTEALNDEEEEEEDSDLEKKNDVDDEVATDIATVIGDEAEGDVQIQGFDKVPGDLVGSEEAEEEETDVPPLDGAADNVPASGAEVVVNDEMTDAGLAGAEGAQTQTQEIAGNDHIDAAAGDTEGPAEQENNLVDDGHAGAGEGQTQAQTIPGAANAMAVAPTGEEAELSIPQNIETASVEQQADTSSVEIGDTAADAAGDVTEIPATDDLPVAEEPEEVAPAAEEVAGEETTTDDESTVDNEVDQDDVDPMTDDNYDDDENEKSNEALNTFLTSKGLDESEIATIASYIGEGSLAAKLHNGSPQLMAKVMPFVREITTLIKESGAKKVGTPTVTRDGFVATVNEAFNGTTQSMADRIITAYDNLDVAMSSRSYNMAMNESVSGEITGRQVLEITHKAVGKLAYYNETTKFNAVLESIESVLTSGKKMNEALDVNVKVCMKGSEKHGVITSINSAEQTYVVLWDGGETGEYGQDQLEELSAEIADNDNDNIEAGEAANKKAEEEAVSGQSNATNEGFENNRAAINDTTDPEGLKSKLMDYIMGSLWRGGATDKHVDDIEATLGDIMIDLKSLDVDTEGDAIEELAHLLTTTPDKLAPMLTAIVKKNANLVDDRMSEGAGHVSVGDTVTLYNDSVAPDEETYEVESKVQKVFSDGTILADDRGHGVRAKFGDGGWTMIEDDEDGDIVEKKTEVVTESTEEDGEEEINTVWTKAKITIDFGPFKEDEVVEIDATQFVAAGDQDAIKLKDPKDEITTVPKKYLKVQDGGDDTTTELDGKLDNALKSLEDVETLLQSEDKINKQEISDAVGKIKAFKDALKSGE